MKASLIFQTKFNRTLANGKTLVFFMDLYLLPVKRGQQIKFPDHYRFSWIAFDPDTPENRVLFDCHKDKGAHAHFDGRELEKKITVASVDDAEKLFYELVAERFGPMAQGDGK